MTPSRASARAPVPGVAASRSAVSRVAVSRAACAVAMLCAALACAPQDIYLFDAAPTETQVDAGVNEPSLAPPPEPARSEPPPRATEPEDDGPARVQPACESAACDACVERRSCDVSGAQLFCHPATGRCSLPCDADAPPQQPGNCPAAERCDPRRGLCVDCVLGSDCGGSLPVCDAQRGSCVECLAARDCPATRPLCDPESSRCVECSSDVDCRTTGEVCLSGAQRCVQCRDDVDCAALGGGHCLQAEQRCVECVSNADCLDPRRPTCSSERECDDDGADDSGDD